jgi:hypothetical protein
MLDNIDDEDKKILLALAFAKGAAPPEYISFHTGIKDPIKILKKMEKVGLVHRSKSSGWSHSMSLMFEITPQARRELFTSDLICMIDGPGQPTAFKFDEFDTATTAYDEEIG